MTQQIIIPRWRGQAGYVFVIDEAGSIIRVVHPDDTFLRCGAND